MPFERFEHTGAHLLHPACHFLMPLMRTPAHEPLRVEWHDPASR